MCKRYSLFVLWPSAISALEQVRERLSEEFDNVAEYTITWPKEDLNTNSRRLYESALYAADIERLRLNPYLNKVGQGHFKCFVVSFSVWDEVLRPTVSGNFDIVYSQIHNVKKNLRFLIEQDTGIKYAIHSTNNQSEFKRQAPLLLGIENYRMLLRNEMGGSVSISKFQGTHNWPSFESFFEYINESLEYVVLRNAPKALDDLRNDDLDILCKDYQEFASFIGLEQKAHKPYKGSVYIQNQKVDIDIRSLNDGYMDSRWCSNILASRVLIDNCYVPNEDDGFFSLLYHVIIHKKSIHSKYRGFINEGIKKYHSSEQGSTNYGLLDYRIVLRGYLNSRNYQLTTPVDNRVTINKRNYRFISRRLRSVDFKPLNKSKLYLKKVYRRVIHRTTP